jgi:hypothetical protein
VALLSDTLVWLVGVKVKPLLGCEMLMEHLLFIIRRMSSPIVACSNPYTPINTDLLLRLYISELFIGHD